MIKYQLQRTQQRIKSQADKRRTEREFAVGDSVLLQPYVQLTVASRSSQKLSLRFYGSFKTIQRVGQVPYELNFLIDAKIHPVVHVSQLKQHIPATASVSSDLSSVSSDLTADSGEAFCQTR